MNSEVVIHLRNLKIQQQKNLILDDVNLQVKKGEFIYLVGKTGSGKSSLLRTLYRDIKLNDGEGTIVGFDIHKIKTRKIPHLRRKLNFEEIFPQLTKFYKLCQPHI